MTREGGFDRAAAERLFVRSPFHALLGLKLDDLSAGSVRIVLPFRSDLLADDSSRPYIHGGVMATLLDVAGHYAVASIVGRAVPTIDMRVDFLRPGPAETLVATAHAIKIGRSVAVADASIEDAYGNTIAIGRLLFGTSTNRMRLATSAPPPERPA